MRVCLGSESDGDTGVGEGGKTDEDEWLGWSVGRESEGRYYMAGKGK